MKNTCSTRLAALAIARLALVLPAWLALSAWGTIRYVDLNSTHATPPYTNWATAATIIQDAVDAAAPGDEIVVTNGTYFTGGRAVYGTMTNRVAVTKPLAVRSVNGPQVTAIFAKLAAGTIGTIRCVYLASGASLSGFTLANGYAGAAGDATNGASGGGIWCESSGAIVSNCLVLNNSGRTNGGGAYGGTLNNCTFTGNSAGYGGGAAFAMLNNCTLIGNSAGYGGGVAYGTLSNCTLTNNSGTGGGAYRSALDNCRLVNNSGSFYGPGGAFESTLTNCILSGNWRGGAVGGTLDNCILSGNSGCGAANGTLNNCTLTGNSNRFGGGAFGGTLNNCTLTGNSASDDGGGTYGGTLNNCTLIGNSAGQYGGGAYAGTLNNCTLIGNSAGYGGGVYECTLNNCTLTTNSAHASGGGAYGSQGSTLNNCVLSGNTAGYAGYGGGVYGCTLNNCTVTCNSARLLPGCGVFDAVLNNCIVYFNTYYSTEANYSGGLLYFCCTTPLPASGFGNIASDPLFVDVAAGNFRLQSNSPCINAGLNAYALGPTDLDGRPRISGGPVDLGAYEFQPAVSGQFIAWLQGYGLPTDGSADFADPDADGHTTWQEWRCLTDPTNALSVLRLFSASRAGTNVTVIWQSVAGVSYFLERSTNLLASQPFTLLAPNLTGKPGTTTFTDTNASAASRLFYRVGVP